MPELTVRELADLCGAELDGDADLLVVGPAALQDAGPHEVSFLAQPRYEHQLAETRAGAVLVAPHVERPREDLVLLRCEDPDRAFSAVVRAFAEPLPRPEVGIHPTAVVHASAEVAADAAVGALVVVGAGARVGPRAVLHAGAVLGAGASVGEESELYPNVVLYPQVEVGCRCIVHSGSVLGSDGFGFEPSKTGWIKVPQCGTVVLEDEVEIGSGCTVDRGRFGPTRIGRGAKLDSQVHLAHNVQVGPGSLLVAQVGIAGSSRLGASVVLGGQVGVAGHVEIGDGARVTAQSGVYSDIDGGRDYHGSPAQPRWDELRRMANTRKIGTLLGRIRELEQRLAALEDGAR